MISQTRMVQMAVRQISPGDLFTAGDLADILGITPGVIGQILSRGMVGSELAEIRTRTYRYPDGNCTSRKVRIYRRVPCPTTL